LSEEEQVNTNSEIVIEDIKISELKPFQNKFRLNFKVVEKEEEREVKNRNNPEETHRISNITVADDTGSIVLTAWDADIDTLSEDKFYSLENGYCNLFNDSMRLVRGKFGEFTEIDSEFEPNLALNRSEEKHQSRRPRTNYNNNRGGSSYSSRGNGNFNYGNFSNPNYGSRRDTRY
jgi:replication factor A1